MKWARGSVVNLVLLALAAGSGVAIWLTQGSVSTQDSAGREQNLLPVFRSDDVLGLDLSQNGRQLSLERSSAASDAGPPAFHLTAPVRELADAPTVEKWLSALGSAKALRAVAADLPASQLGLDNPATRVTLRTRQTRYEIALGGPAPAPEGARYARVIQAGSEPRTLLLAKSTAEELALELDDFRQRSLVPVNEGDVNRLAISGKQLNVRLVRGVGKSFLVDGSAKQRADRDLVTGLFFQLGRLSASRFLEVTVAESALGDDRSHFELQTVDTPAPLAFDIGTACPGDPSQLVLLRSAPSPAAGCVPRDLAGTLELAPEAFLDRHAFMLHPDEVEELDISGSPAKFRLLRKGSGFVLRGAADSDVELETGNQRLAGLLEVQGELVPSPKLTELGLEPERARVTLRSSAARREDVLEEVVRVGKADGDGNLYVYREQDGVVLRVSRDQARAFAPNPGLLRARKLVEFGPSSFISAEITRGASVQRLLRGSDGNLRLELPKGFEPDGVLATDVVQALGALDAERFVAESDDGSFGLQTPLLSVRFTSKNENAPETTHTLRLGREAALGVFATLDQDGPVFTLARSVRDTLDLLLINRSILPTQPAALQSFALEARGVRLNFERRGDSFTVSPKGGFPEARVPDLLEALANLRPEAALHLGPATPNEGFGKPSLVLRLLPKVGRPLTVTFGTGDSWRSTSVFYARISGTEATFVVAQSKVRALSDAL